VPSGNNGTYSPAGASSYDRGSSASGAGQPAATTAGRPVYVGTSTAGIGSLGCPTGITEDRVPRPAENAPAVGPAAGQKPIIRTILPEGAGEGSQPVPN
jgi:hypothetical protein